MADDLPPPLDEKLINSSPEKGRSLWGGLMAGCGLLLLLLAGGGFFVWKVSQETLLQIRETGMQIREADLQRTANQMHPGFLRLLEAVESVLDEPVSEKAIGKTVERGSLPYIEEAKDFLKQEKYEDLNRFLSACYKDKLMTKEGFFVYAIVLKDLANTENPDDWVAATGGSHAFITAGLREIKLAWDSRGSGWSSTVTRKGRKGFKYHLQEATEHYKKAIEDDKQNSVAYGLLMTIGLGRGGLDGVIPQVIQVGTEHTPEDGLLATGIAYYLTPRWGGSEDQMIAFVQDELKRWPDSGGKFDCLIVAIDMATNWGDKKYHSSNSDTQEMFKKIISKYADCWPEGSYATGRIAKLLISDDCYDEAIVLCNARLESLPNKAELYHWLGRALYYKTEYAEAKDVLLKSLDLGSKDPLTYFYLACTATRAKDFKTGEMAALKATSLLPDSERWEKGMAYAKLAQCVAMRADNKASLEYGTKAIEIDPEQSTSWYIRGFANANLSKHKEAKADFLKAIKLKPSYVRKVDKEWPEWRGW